MKKYKPFTIKQLNRFWAKVKITSPNSCWLWTANKDKDGYGRLRIQNKDDGAHRISFIIYYGDIPSNCCVMHKCDTPSCVNPTHLVVGNNILNTKDRDFKQRQAKGEKNGNCKLTKKQVAKIKELSASGLSSRKVGRIFGISKTHVLYIRGGKAWKHLVKDTENNIVN